MDIITLDEAIELLEIIDINDVAEKDLPAIRKRAFRRWHPDTISHTGDEALQRRYAEQSQRIPEAIEVVRAFLRGEYQAGERVHFETKNTRSSTDILREQAPNLQQELRRVWDTVKKVTYKREQEEVLVADGFVLGDLLRQDLSEDVQQLAILSMAYFTLITIPALLLFSALGLQGVFLLFWLIQIIACIILFLPLSRFWLPNWLADIALWFVNLGLNIGNGITNWFGHRLGIALMLAIPRLFAGAIKLIIVYPLYFLAIAIVGKRVVGKATERINYFAGAAEWYIDQLLEKPIDAFSDEELFHLGQLYSELSDVDRHLATVG